MTNPKLSDFDFGSLGRYELTLPTGMKIKPDGTQEDHSRAMEALDQIGPLLQNMPSAEIVQQPAPSTPKSEALIPAVKKWLANCGGGNGPRTVVTKTYHIKDFMARSFSHAESVECWPAESQNTDVLKERADELHDQALLMRFERFRHFSLKMIWRNDVHCSFNLARSMIFH